MSALARGLVAVRVGDRHAVRIDSAGLPFIVIAALPSLAAATFGAGVWAAWLVALPVAIALFFRDPDRVSPADPALVLAPADGKVTYAGDARPEEAPEGRWRQVSIFLSVFDVHVNRTPVGGRVARVERLAGTFLPAYRPAAHRNERSEIWIDHAGTWVVARQIVGVLARRVVCRVRPGQVLAPGARIGLMKFGSRMDVFVPVSADLSVEAGDTVRAGVTVIAMLRRSAS